MPRYNYQLSQTYLLQGIKRYRQQKFKRFLRVSVKTFCFVGLALLTAVSLSGQSFILSGIFGGILLLLLTGPRIDYWLLLRKFKRSPLYNNIVISTLSTQGYHCECELSKVELSWRMFSTAYRMQDGFLIFDTQQQYYWWPDSALKEGSVDEVEQLLKQFIPHYKS